ncbi:hypothetical protein MEO40_27835, partial [Dolichospermum sp. ST_sed1]|nr:hypothetical protein [Dolichospermum sp. ST_sed1]
EVLDRGGYFADGMAVLGFQDSAEMFLRVIAEFLHANIKDGSAFNQIIDEIDKVSTMTQKFQYLSATELII